MIRTSTVEEINAEAMKTYYVKKSLEQAKRYPCYTENSNGFKDAVDAQFAIVNDHYKLFATLTYDQMIDIEDGVGDPWSTFLLQSDIMLKNYNVLIESNPQCYCQALCSTEGAKGKKVNVNGRQFYESVYLYEKNSASPYGNVIGCWDVSIVTDMSGAFASSKLNEPLNCWDTKNVRNMFALFQDAENFNQDLDQWDTSNVDNMSYTFYRATNFNGNISTWDVSNVENFKGK